MLQIAIPINSVLLNFTTVKESWKDCGFHKNIKKHNFFNIDW